MNTQRLIELLEFDGQALETPGPAGWSMVETQLGYNLPNDYKSYIDHFGSGYIDRFIWIYNPFASKPSMNLSLMVERQRKALHEIKEQIPDAVPYKIHPEDGGLLACGFTANGDRIYWLTEGREEDWKVVVNESRGPDWEVHGMGIVEFLCKIISKETTCGIFPDNVPSEDPSFVPQK